MKKYGFGALLSWGRQALAEEVDDPVARQRAQERFEQLALDANLETVEDAQKLLVKSFADPADELVEPVRGKPRWKL